MEDKEKIRVLLTGPTGIVGKAFFRECVKGKYFQRIDLTVLVRDSKKNRKFIKQYQDKYGINVLWGDLTSQSDIEKAIKGQDCVLHVGGMVSPAADYYPEKTMTVNVGSARDIVAAIKKHSLENHIKLVYLGSVSQTGMRHTPYHWGRIGDPVWGANYDWYAESKIQSERIIAESGIRKWVSLRLPGILSPLILKKGSDPITFHVPLTGVLEWVTDEDVARALISCVLIELPDGFWRNFYNVSSGPDYRLTNYEFMQIMLRTLHCPPCEKIFDARWFAKDNFHGMWYEDSDELENWLHFRCGMRADAYFHELERSLPFYFKLAGIVPSFLIKFFMKQIAFKSPLGPLYWWKNNDRKRLDSFFGKEVTLEDLKNWDELDLERPNTEAILLDHGYDESKRDSSIDIEDMRKAAEFRGGICVSENMQIGDLDQPLEWECREKHRFKASPRLVLKGGHWCPECFHPDADLDKEASGNPFYAQVRQKRKN